jgi:uroporphyrinogen-III synthase
LRAQAGREWLARRFAEAGAEVEILAVYSRTEPVPDAASIARVAGAMHGRDEITVLISSSEAIDALDRQLNTVAGAAQFLRGGRALATHPRIAEQLLAAGYTRVELAESDPEALVAQL